MCQNLKMDIQHLKPNTNIISSKWTDVKNLFAYQLWDKYLECAHTFTEFHDSKYRYHDD